MNLSEIFKSIQGESSYVGLPCIFIRTAGCNLDCSYCDTLYAREKGEQVSINDICKQVENLRCDLVNITGGEPLLQSADTNKLARALIKQEKKVLIETNGSLNINRLPREVIRIMDIKCPDSLMSHHTDWRNIDRLTPMDEVKFVLSSRQDYTWTRKIIKEYQLVTRVSVLLSVVFDRLKPATVVAWLLQDNLQVRFQLQLQKYIWSPQTRGV